MMRPAFSSIKQAGTFVLLLLVVLLSPVFAGKKFLPPREQSYAVQGWGSGPYPWIRQQIFEETNDIDMAFVGSSLMMWGINTPYIQAKLSEKLGRQAVVRTIAWGGTGFDALYFISQDLLAHRKVKMLVFYDERNWDRNDRNTQAPLWFRFGDNAGALRGLPLDQCSLFYFSAIIGLPRNVLALVSPVIPMPPLSPSPNYMETNYKTPNPATRLGSVAARVTCSEASKNRDFIPFTPSHPADPNAVQIYSPSNQTDFSFGGTEMPAWQLQFVEKFVKLADEHGCRLVMLHFPQIYEMHSAFITERALWPDKLHAPISMIGVAPSKLFDGLDDEQIYRLYANSGRDPRVKSAHLNEPGQAYYTAAIAPALFKIFDEAPVQIEHQRGLAGTPPASQ